MKDFDINDIIKNESKHISVNEEIFPWGGEEWNSFYPGSESVSRFGFPVKITSFYESLMSEAGFSTLSQIKNYYSQCSPLLLLQLKILCHYRSHNNCIINEKHTVDLIRYLEGEKISSLSPVGTERYAENISSFSRPELKGYFHVHTALYDGQLTRLVKSQKVNNFLSGSITLSEETINYDQDKFLKPIRNSSNKNKKYTGNWIIIKKEGGKNIYLAICPHSNSKLADTKYTDNHVKNLIDLANDSMPQWLMFIKGMGVGS